MSNFKKKHLNVSVKSLKTDHYNNLQKDESKFSLHIFTISINLAWWKVKIAWFISSWLNLNASRAKVSATRGNYLFTRALLFLSLSLLVFAQSTFGFIWCGGGGGGGGGTYQPSRLLKNSNYVTARALAFLVLTVRGRSKMINAARRKAAADKRAINIYAHAPCPWILEQIICSIIESFIAAPPPLREWTRHEFCKPHSHALRSHLGDKGGPTRKTLCDEFATARVQKGNSSANNFPYGAMSMWII